MINGFSIKDNFKYLVVDTGYTSRLINIAHVIEYEIRDQTDWLCDGEVTPGTECEHCKPQIVLIHDHPDHFLEKENHLEGEYITDMSPNFNGSNSSIGIIAFKCES